VTGYEAIVALAAIEGAVRLYRIRAENKAAAARIAAATERRAAQ
jgi:hypothetical protein